MKKMNVSLIVKIAGLIFVAFAIVLGNEIRLGIDRYIKNTLETDAYATIRVLDKFAKEYSDLTIYNNCSIDSQEFQNIYATALSGDSSLVKSLVKSNGKVMDVSRETMEDSMLCMIVENFNLAKNMPSNPPLYFHLSSIGKDNIEKLEKVLNDEKAVRKATLSIVFPKNTNFSNNEFENINIAKIIIDGQTVVERKVSGQPVDIKGQLSFYTSQYKEVFFGNNKELITYGNFAHAISDNEKTIVIDYHDAMRGVQNQLSHYFKQYTSVDKIFNSTNYADYYLLKPYKYNGKYYSTVMMKVVDWSRLNDYYNDEKYNHLDEDQKLAKATEGYVLVTKEYNQITSTAMQQYIMDNFSSYLLTFILISIICALLAYILVKPIHRIERIAKHISKKEFNYPINTKRRDELGDLARSVDMMSKELEKTINDLYLQVEKVQSLETIRKEFVANFTHEIKTPLGIINGFSELVEIEQDEAKKIEYIHIIQGETKKINTLVLAMLEYSKLESDTVTLSIEEVDFLELIDDAIDSLSYLIKKKNIHLKTSLESVIVQADRFKMQMVMNNFISNALRYTADDKTIEIKLTQNTFTIENEGAYIPEEDMDKIWLTFHKVDKSRSEEGTGLGLAICRAALELHHFEYGVKNTETGVLFYFCFQSEY